MICFLKDKIMNDLFCPKDKNLEDLFSESIKHYTNKKNRSQNNYQIFRKTSKNSFSNIKDHDLIIQEISSLLRNKELNTMYKQLNSEKILLNHSNSDKILITNFNSINHNNHNFIETNADEKLENKDLFTSLNYTSTTAEVKTNKLNDKVSEYELLDKEKIVHIFNEIKDKYLQKKENTVSDSNNEKVYAQSLEKNQIFSLFSKYFDEKINNSQELYLILTNGNFKDNRLFLGKKSKRNENLSEKDLEKTFYTRKGICQHLSKVINKLVYII